MKILVIDDHEVLRDGIKSAFARVPGHFEFGDAGSFDEAWQMAQEQPWSLAILDLSLGMRDGLELLKEIRSFKPTLPVLVLSMYSELQYGRRSIRAGAAGYVAKTGRMSEFIEAVRRVLSGGRYVSPCLAEALAADLQGGRSGSLHEALSDRELEVMRLIALGRTVGEIAAELSLSNKTVSTYRARLLQKTGLKSNAEITRYALTHQLVA